MPPRPVSHPAWHVVCYESFIALLTAFGRSVDLLKIWAGTLSYPPQVVKEKSNEHVVTLMYGAQDEEHNEALVLKRLLERHPTENRNPK
jgi:hypothetical protein